MMKKVKKKEILINKLKEIFKKILIEKKLKKIDKNFIEKLHLFFNSDGEIKKFDKLILKDQDKIFNEKYHVRLIESIYQNYFSIPDYSTSDELFEALNTFYECKRANYQGILLNNLLITFIPSF